MQNPESFPFVLTSKANGITYTGRIQSFFSLFCHPAKRNRVNYLESNILEGSFLLKINEIKSIFDYEKEETSFWVCCKFELTYNQIIFTWLLSMVKVGCRKQSSIWISLDLLWLPVSYFLELICTVPDLLKNKNFDQC